MAGKLSQLMIFARAKVETRLLLLLLVVGMLVSSCWGAINPCCRNRSGECRWRWGRLERMRIGPSATAPVGCAVLWVYIGVLKAAYPWVRRVALRRRHCWHGGLYHDPIGRVVHGRDRLGQLPWTTGKWWRWWEV